MLTWQDFVERWGASTGREQQDAQSHFNELCQLINHKTPTQLDPAHEFFTFAEHVEKATGGRGRADVFYRGHFAWEYKGKHRDLDAAYGQLLAYKGGLENPPLLVVCDFLTYKIYPQWTNASGLPFTFTNADLLHPDAQNMIRWLLEAPEKFKDYRQSELEKRERLTLKLANQFAQLADLMKQVSDQDGLGWETMQIARFLTKLMFALFAEDVELLPKLGIAKKGVLIPIFRYIVDATTDIPEEFVPLLTPLFEAMDGRKTAYIGKYVPYFNGGLFRDTLPDQADGLEILDLGRVPGAIDLLGEISEQDWRFVNPSIFGTLFEGALDPSKRAQLGAHYTSEDDIRLVIDPVLMQPLYREWEQTSADAQPLLQTYKNPASSPRDKTHAEAALRALHDHMMHRLESTKVLDPACGSGNFLYVALRALKDLEAKVRNLFEPLGLPYRDVVTPRQLYGIEKDIFAARLAHVVVWIGYLQWRYEQDGLLYPVLPRSLPHPRNLPNPIIQDKLSANEPDRIINDDAIMRYDADGKPYEPEWADVDVIVGNPPFLGDKYMRFARTELKQEGLGNKYVDDLRSLYQDRLPSVDLVCYWYEKARAAIEQSRAKRAGFLATNSIRGGANRKVLDRIKETGDIFMAWGDRPWVLQGAAVRISVIGFDDGTQKDYVLDGAPVDHINADLQNTIDATKAKVIATNRMLAFQGPVKVGAFDIANSIAEQFLNATNPNAKSNRDVIKPYLNGEDIVQRSRNYWIIDFGDLSEKDAALYEAPFRYVETYIKPTRLANRDLQRRTYWWRLGRGGDDYRLAVHQLKRQIFTSRVSKYRLFAWVDTEVFPSDAVVAIAREDDYFFGVLHSYLHEQWSLRLGTWLGKGNDPRYTPTTTFETFPFPYTPGQEDTSAPAYAAISAAAQALNQERDLWLNPPDLLAMGAKADDPVLRERTLTNLYNALEDLRHPKRETTDLTPQPPPRIRRGAEGQAAREFAPRLHALHDALDQAVLAAYGWDDLVDRLRTADGDEELLRRLLALNVVRAGG